MKDRLVIIESDPINKEILEKVLIDTYEILFVKFMKILQDQWYNYNPELILYDMHSMDPQSLFYLGGMKRKCGNLFHFIMLVSENNISFERIAREQGVFYYMIRPFEYKELREVLGAAFHQIKKRRLKKNLFGDTVLAKGISYDQ